LHIQSRKERVTKIESQKNAVKNKVVKTMMLSQNKSENFIVADWPAPQNIHTFITTRRAPYLNPFITSSDIDIAGMSEKPYEEFNLATHVRDNEKHVLHNRRLLNDFLYTQVNSPEAVTVKNDLDSKGKRKVLDFLWLSQVHSIDLVEFDHTQRQENKHNHEFKKIPCADGSYTRGANKICTILTADCLPVLMCNKQGTQVAAVHAGWQGLANGIISEALKTFECEAKDILCYLGPAISGLHYEVGRDVVDAFLEAEKRRPYLETIMKGFTPLDVSNDDACKDNTEQKYLADLYQLARLEIFGFGCMNVYGGGYCSHSDCFEDMTDKFYSYRRDGVTGRMASLIWIE